MAQIDNTLYDAFGQRQIATFYTQVNQYRVVLEAAPAIGDGPEALDHLYVTGPDGAQVPLSQLVRVSRRAWRCRSATRASSRRPRSRSTRAPDVSLGQATAAIDKATLAIGMPASIHASFAGTAQAFRTRWLPSRC